MAADNLDTGGLGDIHDAQQDYYGQRQAVASGDTCVYIFEITDGPKKPSACLKGHDGPVWKVSWAHPKFGMNRSSVVASCSFDMKVIVWKETNPGQWQIAHCDTSHTASVNSVQFCPWEFGLRLACASSDGTVSVLSHNPQDQSWHHASFPAHAGGVQELCWAPSPDPGSCSTPVARVATAGCDCGVKVWRLENECWAEERPSLPPAHTDWVRGVAWRPDDARMLASGSWDKTVVVWQQSLTGSPNGRHADADGYWQKSVTLQVRDKVEGLAWSETGGVLAVSFGEGEATLFKENDGDYVEVATFGEAGLQDVPNSLNIGSFAEAQVTGPKVKLEPISSGDGMTFPKVGDMLTMHYTGRIAATGAEFDSSHKRQKPFEFQIGLGKVIQGWDEGVIQMSLGQKALLKVPYQLGYGEEGAGNGVIPPCAELHFEVELLKIN